MTKEKFYADYCKSSNMTIEEGRRFGLRAEKCHCNDICCSGWRMDVTFVKHNDSIEIGDVECLFDSHIISIDSANQTISIGECMLPIPEGKEDYLVKYLSEFVREVKLKDSYLESVGVNKAEPFITDFIPLIGTDRKIEFCVNTEENNWIRGTVHGVNVPSREVLVLGDNDNGNTFFVRWFPLFFQLTPNNKKYFKVRIV